MDKIIVVLIVVVSFSYICKRISASIKAAGKGMCDCAGCKKGKNDCMTKELTG